MVYGRILLTERDRQMRDLLYSLLTDAGFVVTCVSETGMSERMLTRQTADVAVLSVLPESDYCARVLEMTGRAPEIPVIVMLSGELSGKRLSYLRQGADEVLIKPVDITELALRLRTFIRRERSSSVRISSGLLSVPNCGISVDMYSYTAFADGVPVRLPPKEIEILQLLLSNPDRVFRRDEIASYVWGESLATERTVDSHISHIKSVIGRPYADCISAVRGVGYKLSVVSEE